MKKGVEMKRKKYILTLLLSLGLAVTACGSEKDSNTEPTKASEVVEINTGNSDKTGKQENNGNSDEKEGNAADSKDGSASKENDEKKPDGTDDTSEKTETDTKTLVNESDKEEQPDIIGIGEKPGESGDNGSSNSEQGSGSTEQGSAGSGNSGNSEQGSSGSGENGNCGNTRQDGGEQGSAGNGGSTESSKTGSVSASDFTVSLNGNKLSCGDDFLPFVDKMGIIAKIEEGQACLEGGYDTNYYYSDVLAVYTIAKDGKQLIYDIYITGSDYPSAKGVKTGTTTKDEVRSLYGEPSSTLPAADKYELGTKTLSLEYKGGVVSGIDISDSSVK